MSDYNWCHGPSCHTNKTQDRIRGVKGSKVLRTRKVLQTKWNTGVHLNMYSYFCSNGCYNDFANKHISQVIAIAPRLEALETPITDPVKTKHNNGYYDYTNTEFEIVGIDNA